jgi:hypothetical protein
MTAILGCDASRLVAGRALYIGRNGELYVARRFAIHRSDDGGHSWRLDCFVPVRGWRPMVCWSRLAARLLRHYIAAFEVLPDGSRIAVARDGVYRAAPNEAAMTCAFRLTRGSRPLNLAVDGQRVLFGEYGSLSECEVRIYVSEDGGKTFDVGYQFAQGDIRHVHNIVFDPGRGHYWVMTGDYDRQPGIAALSRDLKTLDWISRGSQHCRAVGVIHLRDRFVYGTDSNQDRNFIVTMDKQSGRVERLREVEGSSLFATSFGPFHAISTCVEPNPACPSRESVLYASADGDVWTRVASHRKDRHDFDLFQFGTIVLPRSRCDKPLGMYSGQAVQTADDATFLLSFRENASSTARLRAA